MVCQTQAAVEASAPLPQPTFHAPRLSRRCQHRLAPQRRPLVPRRALENSLLLATRSAKQMAESVRLCQAPDRRASAHRRRSQLEDLRQRHHRRLKVAQHLLLRMSWAGSHREAEVNTRHHRHPLPPSHDSISAATLCDRRPRLPMAHHPLAEIACSIARPRPRQRLWMGATPLAA